MEESTNTNGISLSEIGESKEDGQSSKRPISTGRSTGSVRSKFSLAAISKGSSFADYLNAGKSLLWNEPALTFENEKIGKMMWTRNYIGLYAHYAAVGFNGGMISMALNFCAYSYKGAPNLCANSPTIITLPWR